MRSIRLRLWRIALIAILAIVLAGVIAPFMNAAAFSSRIQRALELSLGRSVTFTSAHFTLFSGPGFSLQDVTISEDPRFGREPFAYVPNLEARVRFDKLVLGKIAFSSLRLVDPSLNVVKNNEGNWNIVELVRHLSVPSALPLNLFPPFGISDGRIDFKFGTRKTTLYISDSDLSIFPERSGKLYIQFSGSPARTDRAGNGFGHLRGNANWYLRPPANSNHLLEADLTLDPSDLSELTTLFEGHDIGIHGLVSSHAKVVGPAGALRITGELRLEDVHRWDLLPSRGEDWRIGYNGNIDVVGHRLELRTVPAHSNETTPVALDLRVNQFLTHPSWALIATLNQAPAGELLPVSRRMGLSFPAELNLGGTITGAVGYSSTVALSGAISIDDVVANLPDTPPLQAKHLTATISPDRIHFDPVPVQAAESGHLQVGGDYGFLGKKTISFQAVNLPIEAFKRTLSAWFGAPAAFSALAKGRLTGQVAYLQDGQDPATWNGQFRFAEATIAPPGFAAPLIEAQGRVSFDDSSFDLDRFSATVGKQVIAGTYHYNSLAKRPERLRVDVPAADLTDLESALEPSLRAQGLLARLGVARRTIPPWLKTRNLQADISVGQFSIGGAHVGSLRSRVNWQGANLHFPSLRLNLPGGSIDASGTVSLSSNLPRYRFAAAVNRFSWRNGNLSAAGELQSSGLGTDVVEHLQANGTFSGQGLSLSADDLFDSVSGFFQLSLAGGWPDLRLSNVQVSEGEEAWTGTAASQSDGRLVIDLENAGRQRRVVSTLVPETPAVLPSAVASRESR